jgi:class 3 adenylate cyclase/tetratricopeptide (TPR) repeat protein
VSVRARLQPFLPRLTLDWLADDPSRTWRAVDGSMVFVDISGFTKLSEKLAKAGKVGAEQMADAINHCFTELLAVAYEENGSLLKFGGDALLLLFEGGEAQEHVGRAVRAAAGMRKRLREVGKIETERGTVGLRMSVGVHTGTFHFFLVGESHRELLIAGPGASGVVEMEGTADAGEIVVSTAIASMLPRRCVGAPKGPGFLLRSAPVGEPPGLVAVIPSVEDDLIRGCVPVATREQLLAGTSDPEHRQASVAFLHFDGTDELLMGEGPDVVAEALHELVRDVQAAVDELQVCFLSTDVDHDGGKIILTAGVPRAVGEDEERMLLALRKIADRERRLPLRIGVNHGPLFSGDIGPTYRRTYTVMGDTVNLAARVMSKAPPGDVYATETVLDRSATRFEVTEIEPFMVKGKAKPVHAWAVGAAVGSRAREEVQARRLSLVGRDAEVQVLQELAERARQGEGQLVEIVGEPGIGKSRLLEELAERASDLRLLHATAEAYTSSTPYATWRELLRELLDVGWEDPDEIVEQRLRAVIQARDPDLLPWLPLLANAVDIDVPSTPEVDEIAAEFRRPKLHEVMSRFLRVALGSPTLIQIEDGHLMDPASAELLGSLTTGLEGRAWLIAVARRESGSAFSAQEGDHVRKLEMSPLSAEATREMVLAATESAPLLPHDEQLVAERSGGNPQFLLDLVRAMEAGSMLPDSVEAAATARIDSLSPSDRALVRRASVFGVSFHPRHIGDVLDAGGSPPEAETWERLGEFFEDDGDGFLRFRRAVVRDAAYEGLPFRTRRSLHRSVAERVESEAADEDEVADVLSLHFFLAADHERAYRYAGKAADRAASRFAVEEAAHLYQRAIDASRRLQDDRSSEVVQLYVRLIDVLRDAGDFRRAADACSVARRYCGPDRVTEAGLLLRRSRMEARLGGYSRALWWATRARTVLADTEGREARSMEARVASFYAVVLERMGRVTECARWGTRAAEEAEAAGDRRALAEAYDTLDTLNLDLGRPTGEHWRRASQIFEELGDLKEQVRILSNSGVGSYAEGRWDEAMSLYERSREVGLRIGDVVGSAADLMNLSEILLERGSIGEAERHLRESLRVMRASGDGYFIAACLCYLGRATARSGRPKEALELYAEAEAAYAAIGAPDDVVEVKVRAAECHAMLQDPDAALALLEDAESGLGQDNMWMPLLRRIRGYALAQKGEPVAARAEFEQSLALARARGAPFEIAEAIIPLVRMGVAPDGVRHADLAEEANAILQRLGVAALTSVPLVAASNGG